MSSEALRLHPRREDPPQEDQAHPGQLVIQQLFERIGEEDPQDPGVEQQHLAL